jgi:FkbM family methyltransferase
MSNMKSFLRSLTPPLLYEAMRDVKTRVSQTSKDRKYRIGKNVITIPGDHNLPAYQVAHRLYDRFLPVLCSQLPRVGLIVDVGANIGDTIAAIMETCTNRIVAIEGYLPYFETLRRNLTILDPDGRVTPIHALVGSGGQTGSLTANKGTATLNNSGSGRMRSLDDILASWLDQVVMLKVDTDGFDAEVISSGMSMIEASQPILFWEGGTSDAIAFESIYEKLAAAEYDRFWIFDNFGNLMLSECGTKELKDFDRYVASQYRHGCTRTIFYVDVLASTAKTIVVARNAISKYRREFIEIS